MARIVQWAFNCFSWPSIYPCASIFFWRSVAPRTPQATVYSFLVLHHMSPRAAFLALFVPFPHRLMSPKRGKCLGTYNALYPEKALSQRQWVQDSESLLGWRRAPLAPRDPPAGSGRSYPRIPLLGDFFLFALFPPHILYLLSFSAAGLLIILLIWRDQKHLYLIFLCFYLCISQSQ